MVIVTEALETDTQTLKIPAPHSVRSREFAGGQGQNDGRLQVGNTYDLLRLRRRYKLLGLGTAPVAILQEEKKPLPLVPKAPETRHEELVNDTCARIKSRLGTESGSSDCQTVSGQHTAVERETRVCH